MEKMSFKRKELNSLKSFRIRERIGKKKIKNKKIKENITII
jgi:hypothetical protein